MDSRVVLGVCGWLACAVSCDAHVGNEAAAMRADGNSTADTGQVIADAAMLGAWGAPQLIPGASDPTIDEDDCTLNSMTTELYFTIPDTTIAGDPKDLYLMTRGSKSDPWSTAALVTALNTTATEESPRLSPDDLTIYFGRDGDIYSATRTAVGQPWSTPAAVTSVNTAAYEKWMAVCDGGYFMVSRGTTMTGQDFFQGAQGTVGTVVAELNSPENETSTFLSTDCLTVYFASNRGSGTGIYTATRASVTATWSDPTLVTDFGMASDNEDPWMSTDQRMFVFSSVRAPLTTNDLYISTR